jgi:hypothetical protein
VRLAVALAALAVLAGCQQGTLSPEQFQRDFGDYSAVPLVGRSLFSATGAAEIAPLLERELKGRVRATSLVLYANRISLEAFDPLRPTEINRYVFGDGDLLWTQAEPVPPDAAQRAFELRAVPFLLLPNLVDRARAEFRDLRGVTPSVVIARSPLGDRELSIGVYCNAPRGNGWMSFDVHGRLLGRRSS